MKNKVIIINPAHGTAPYIFGVQLAKSIADITGDRFSIVMPDFFGENQRRILKARWGEDSTIYLDKELGIGMQFNGSDSDLEKALELRPRIAAFMDSTASKFGQKYSETRDGLAYAAAAVIEKARL